MVYLVLPVLVCIVVGLAPACIGFDVVVSGNFVVASVRDFDTFSSGLARQHWL